MVASDPTIIRHILKENVFSYDKGVLTEILEPFMGYGLIPAPFEVWKERRRALVPGFHQAWMNRMVRMFTDCTVRLVSKLDKLADTGEIVDMEENWNSCSLDIIGKAVFNYDFGSVDKVSPVVKAALGALREAEHRSTFYIPYWKIPFLGAEWPVPALVPRQRKFQQDMALLNSVLDKLILNVVQDKQETDLDALINKDYDNVNDPSLLRFLVDLRGADATQKQLRDDLITLLIAGHETTGSLLTWATWLLAQHPEALARMQANIDGVLGDRLPTFDDVRALEEVRLVIAETLRLYPEPPILIRRALDADVLPRASNLDGSLQAEGVRVIKGTDFFLSVWNLHRSPLLWERPDEFDPTRWRRPTPQALVDTFNAGETVRGERRRGRGERRRGLSGEGVVGSAGLGCLQGRAETRAAGGGGIRVPGAAGAGRTPHSTRLPPCTAPGRTPSRSGGPSRALPAAHARGGGAAWGRGGVGGRARACVCVGWWLGGNRTRRRGGGRGTSRTRRCSTPTRSSRTTPSSLSVRPSPPPALPLAATSPALPYRSGPSRPPVPGPALVPGKGC